MNDLHEKAVRAYKKGESSYLEAGVILVEMDTKYGSQAVKKVAHAVGKQPKTVYRLRNAGQMYIDIEKLGKTPPDAPYGMYEAAYTLEQRFEVGADYWYAQIDTAVAENIDIKSFSKFCNQELRQTIADLEGKIKGASDIAWWVINSDDWNAIPPSAKSEIQRLYKILKE